MTDRAYFSCSLEQFSRFSDEQIIGRLTRLHSQDLVAEQTFAWRFQCEALRGVSKQFGKPQNAVYFEFSIPRMGKRADVVLLISGVVFVIEFKVGANDFRRADADQALDYSLDLCHFHAGSHNAYIVPIVCATNAEPTCIKGPTFNSQDGVSEVLFCDGDSLLSTLEIALSSIRSGTHQASYIQDATEWAASAYKPTPTIVQAAQALYQGHDVKEISRSDAGAYNLSQTTSEILKIIESSKQNNQKSICFVTGVPGAGKTLAGLNVATKRLNPDDQSDHAVFLSGNGPLVAVLREALARDEHSRLGISKGDATRHAATFIQNIHHFRDDNLKSPSAPVEQVVIFDEAQRAWDRQNTSRFMQTKKNQPGFNKSEPEFLIEVMDRHANWCTVIALIGGGQEINTGEAGLSEWFSALRSRFRDWHIYYSDYLNEGKYINGAPLKDELRGLNYREIESLHLSTSIRSFRAEALSNFVEAFLEGDPKSARTAYSEISAKYPLVVTRDLLCAKEWIKQRSRGGELSGILASSGAYRLRPEGIHVKAKIDPPVWFLNSREDVRSCHFLEEVGTEFDVQGLELDWTIVGWDANLRISESQEGLWKWSHHKFSGTKWQSIKSEAKKMYLINSYRVLLTRARQGMVIFVPYGDNCDETRPCKFYDGAYNYLKACGIEDA